MIYLGYIATFLTSICMIPQVVRTIKAKDLSGISISYFGVLGISNVLWCLYSAMNDDLPIFIVNYISFSSCIFIIGVKTIRERREKAKFEQLLDNMISEVSKAVALPKDVLTKPYKEPKG